MSAVEDPHGMLAGFDDGVNGPLSPFVLGAGTKGSITRGRAAQSPTTPRVSPVPIWVELRREEPTVLYMLKDEPPSFP